MSYKWKPSVSQRKAFAEKMKDPEEQAAYNQRQFDKRQYSNWEHKDFVPTKEQYDFCMLNFGNVMGDQMNAFNMVMSGYICQDKVSHDYIHIVNQLRRKEIELNSL